MKCSVFIFISFFFIAGCTKKALLPKITEPDFSKYIGSSLLVNHISIDKNLLTDTINHIIDDLTKESFKTDEYDVNVEVKRSGSIGISVNKKAILLEIPIHLYLYKNTFLGKVTGEGEVSFTVMSDIEITSDWKLTTKSTLVNHEWLKKPKLNLGVNIPAKYFSDMVIKEISPILLKTIDEAIANEVNLNSIIKETVDQIEEPFHFQDQYEIWYTPTINNIALSEFSDNQYNISTTLQIKATNLVTLSKPMKTLSQLPPFQWTDEVLDSSRLSVLFDINYKEISNILKGQYQGRIIEEAGKRITIENLKILSERGYLVVETSLSGDFNGVIKLMGTPHFDKEKRALSVKEVDIKIDTKNIVAKGASWLLKGKMKKELAKLLYIPLESYAKELQEYIDLNLLDYQKENYIYLYAKLGSYDINNIYFGEDHVKGIINMNLYLSGHLNDVRFFK